MKFSNVDISTVDGISKKEVAIPTANNAMSKMGILSWFLEPQFYLIACISMTAFLFRIISISYMPLYIQHTLKLENIYIALVPLVMDATGFIVTLPLKFLTNRLGFKFAFVLSCLIGIGKKIILQKSNIRLI